MRVFFRLAAGNITKNLRRSLSTGSTIAMGLVGVTLMGGYLLRMERYLATQSVYLSLNGHVVVYAKGGLDRHLSAPSQFSFTQSQLASLDAISRSDKRVAHGAAILRGIGLASNGCVSQPFIALSAPTETLRWTRSHPDLSRFVPELKPVAFGRGFWEGSAEEGLNLSHRIINLLQKEKAVLNPVLESEVALADCSVGERETNDPIVQLLATTFDGGLGLGQGPVVGSVSTGLAFMDDTAALFSLDQARQLFGTEGATSFVFFLQDESNVVSFLTELQQKFGAWSDSYPFYHPEISAFYVGGMEFNWVMFFLFLFLVCGVVGISISNSLYISLVERRDELGTLRSIGFKRKQVVRLLMMENGILAIISLTIGLCISVLVRYVVNSAALPMAIPGLSGEVVFRLHMTPLFSFSVFLVLLLLVLSTTWIGSRRFLNKPILALWRGR
jgi:putative ABC transport system permease protein